MKKLMILTALVFSMSFTALADNPSSEASRYAVILETQGNVEVKLSGAEWTPAEAGVKLFEKDEIRTQAQSTAQILLDQEGSTGKFEVKPNSRLRMGTLILEPATGDKTTILDLAIGSVLVKAEKLQGHSRFEVRTPNATTGVRGTEFLVTAEPKQS